MMMIVPGIKTDGSGAEWILGTQRSDSHINTPTTDPSTILQDSALAPQLNPAISNTQPLVQIFTTGH